jgi:four helix bundle protein
MKKQSILREKSFRLSLDIIELCRSFRDIKVESSINRQVLRSGTAIGAMVREAEFAQSKADFINKLSVALKEANETEYWLELILCSGNGKKTVNHEIMSLLEEVIKMLVSSINTAKGNARCS